MGNKASRGSGANEAAAAEQQSGVFLDPKFNEEIIGQFSSQVLKTEWEKILLKVTTTGNNRVQQEQVRKAQLEAQLTQWRAQNDHVQGQLDEKTHNLQKKYHEQKADIMSNIEELERKADAPKFGAAGNACLNVRGLLASCYKENDDMRKCDDLVDAMEKCTKQTIMA
eukprot:66189_1